MHSQRRGFTPNGGTTNVAAGGDVVTGTLVSRIVGGHHRIVRLLSRMLASRIVDRPSGTLFDDVQQPGATDGCH
jgi:hypothetical protein